MGAGVSQIHAYGVAAVFFFDGHQTILHRPKGLFPGNLDQLAVFSDQRLAQPFRIVMQGSQGGTLWADAASAEGVLFIAYYRNRTSVFYGIARPQPASHNVQVW